MTAAQAQAETLRNALRGETRAVGDWDAFADALDDDFNTPAALAILHELGARRVRSTSCGAASTCSGSRASARCRRRRPTSSRWPSARMAARARRDFAEADRLRDEIAGAGWDVRDAGGGYELVPLRVTRDLVYGRNAVREALRGRRRCSSCGSAERAAATLDWLGEGPRPRVRRGARAHRGCRDRPTTRASSPGASRIPYADAWELASVERRSSAASTR